MRLEGAYKEMLHLVYGPLRGTSAQKSPVRRMRSRRTSFHGDF